MSQLSEFARLSGDPLDFDSVTESELQAALGKIPTSTNPNLALGPSMTPATWMQYFVYNQERTSASVAKLLELGRLLEAGLPSRIVAVTDSLFFSFTRTRKRLHVQEPDAGHVGEHVLELSRRLS